MQNSPERCLLCFPVLSALPENLTDLRNISCIDQRPLVGIKYFTLIHSFLQRSSASVLIFPLINLSLIISSFSQIMERPFFFNFFFISLKMTDFSMKMPLVTLPVRVPIPPQPLSALLHRDPLVCLGLQVCQRSLQTNQLGIFFFSTELTALPSPSVYCRTNWLILITQLGGMRHPGARQLKVCLSFVFAPWLVRCRGSRKDSRSTGRLSQKTEEAQAPETSCGRPLAKHLMRLMRTRSQLLSF